ncbi:unnamed protein product, partial [marine sediment metagenome]
VKDIINEPLMLIPKKFNAFVLISMPVKISLII